MEIAQMKYFQAMAKHQSFSRAAEELHLTQPALSKSIAKLEKELGVQLFERSGNRVALSSIGQLFLRHCDQALLCIDNGLRELRENCGLETGKVCIAVSETIFIKHLICQFLSDFPHASLHCQLESVKQMQESLESGIVDFAISRVPIPGEDIVWQPLYQDALTVLMSSHHPFARKKKIYLEELAKERFILGHLGYGMYSYLYDLCSRAGFKPDVRYEGYDPDLAGMLIHIEHSVLLAYRSISAGVSVANLTAAESVAIPIADDIPLETIGISAKRGHFQSKAALEFYDRVINFFGGLE